MIFIYNSIYLFIYFSAVNRFIAINHIQNKSFCVGYIKYVCVLCMFIMYI